MTIVNRIEDIVSVAARISELSNGVPVLVVPAQFSSLDKVDMYVLDNNDTDTLLCSWTMSGLRLATGAIPASM